MKDLIVTIKTEGDGEEEEEEEEFGTNRSDDPPGAGVMTTTMTMTTPREPSDRSQAEVSSTETGSSSGSFWPDLEVLDPDHPILERFQENLGRLLEEEDQQLTLRIIEMEEKRKRILQERKRLSSGLEDLRRAGEKSQASLNKEKEALDAERARRSAAEAEMPVRKERAEAVRAELERAEAADAELQKRLESARKKLDEMRKKLQEQQEQLAVARGQLDQGVRQRDSSQTSKLFQDVVINQLLSEVEAVEWRRTQTETSLLEEEQLTAGIRDAIRKAHAEVSAINAEKIRLCQSWQSSLVALQRTHDALAATRQSIKNEESRREEMMRCWTAAEKETAELSGKRSGIQLELGRLERKLANMETQFQDREDQKSIHDERNRNIQSILRLREEELQSLAKEAEQLAKSESDALERVQVEANRRKKLEGAVLDEIYRNLACDQEGQAIYKHIRQAEEASQQLDFQIAGMESKNGQLMLEQEQLERELATQAKLLEDQEAAVKDKDGQVSRLELQLAGMHKLVERKEAALLRYRTTVEELNRTMEANDGLRTEEERVIRGLQAQLDECRRATESAQRRWSEAEQSLISVAMARDHQAVLEQKLRDEVVVWEEKKKRLLRQVEELKAVHAQCNRSVHGWREHLQQLDSKLAKTAASKESLERWNQLCQRQWQLELEEPEREVHRMRAKADQLASQQSTLEITLCDLSKVAMLWTCKLADIREAHNYVQAERSDAGALAILQAEKHRLQVQEVQLRKDQEMLNHQLQKEVLGRSGLNTKADLKVGPSHRTRVVQQPVQSNPWHKILSKVIAQHEKEVQLLEKTIGKKAADIAQLILERDELRSAVEVDQKKLDALNEQIAELSSAKKLAVAELAGQQKWWRFWESLKRGEYRRRSGASDPANLPELEGRVRQKALNMTRVADRLAKEYPNLSRQLKEVHSLLQSVL